MMGAERTGFNGKSQWASDKIRAGEPRQRQAKNVQASVLVGATTLINSGQVAGSYLGTTEGMVRRQLQTVHHRHGSEGLTSIPGATPVHQN